MRIFDARTVRSVTPVALRKIIVGCDGSDGAHDALRLAALLGRADRAELILASVYRHDRDHAVALLAEAERAVPYGTRASMRAIEARSPSRALRDLADSEGADLIVIGACNKRGQSSFATGAHCPVAVAPRGLADDPDPGLRVIGVAFDAPPESRAAVEVAAELALAAHATLKLIGIAESRRRPRSA